MGKIPSFNRDKEPEHPVVIGCRPRDPLFDRLTNYRYYRLLNREDRRDAHVMMDAKRRIKAVKLAVGESFKFTGDDPVMVFAFLTRLTEEAGLKWMTDSQIFAAIPRFLRGPADVQFRASRSGSHSGGVRDWPNAV